jgi:tetratricopeptide (TPR) repeat protein
MPSDARVAARFLACKKPLVSQKCRAHNEATPFLEVDMQYPLRLAFATVPLLAVCAYGQFHGGSNGGVSIGVGNVHVHVIFENDRKAGANLLVRLMKGSSSTPVDTTWTNEAGQANFSGIVVGQYNVEVTGDGIVTTRSPTFDVDERKVTQSQYVVVRRVEDAAPKPGEARAPSVSAADLNVPAKARKELDKASKAMDAQDNKKALEHLQKALAIAPRYVTAYNNLGVLYARMNDIPHEREALEKAISFDPHFGPALLNLGRLDVRQKAFSEAEDVLAKEVGIDPTNPESLMLLADAEYMDQHYDAAIGNAQKAHAVAEKHPSFVHYIAARAYQHENKTQQALAEFELFLQEEPKGPRADHVRGDIARITAQAR